MLRNIGNNETLYGLSDRVGQPILAWFMNRLILMLTVQKRRAKDHFIPVIQKNMDIIGMEQGGNLRQNRFQQRLEFETGSKL